MNAARSIALFAATVASVGIASAQQSATRGSQVYQQRLTDGSIVLTDRRVDGARIQRTWEIAREDPEDARRRSELVRQEARMVTERIERRIQHQQSMAEQREIERLRFHLAEARQDAAAARDSIGGTAVVYAPHRAAGFHRWHHPGTNLRPAPFPRKNPPGQPRKRLPRPNKP